MRARQRHLNAKAAGASVVLDSRYITGLSDGSNVSSWSDRSGNSNNATTASNYPTYETNEQAGNPVVRFVSSSSTRLSCSSAAFTGSGSRFLMAAYKSTSTGTYINTAAGQGGVNSTGTWFAIAARTQFATGDPYIGCFGADTQNNKSTPDNAWKVATGAYDGTTLYARKNSSEIDSVNRTLNTNNSALQVGYVNNAEYFNGDIAYVAAGGVAYSLPLLRRLEHSIGFSFKIACS